MVVIDDQYNGWRRLILPIACVDDLVLNSVMAVSSFHLSGRDIGQFTAPPRVFFAQAIYELQKRRNLNKCDLQTKQFVILAIIVLLVTVMVNGCSDFPILFHMLQSALDTIGGDSGLAGGDLADFLRREIHKMRAYGAPFIGQVAGRQVLDSQNQQSFDCLQYYGRLHADHLHLFHRIASLKQQAYLIYMRRIAPDGMAAASTNSIDRFKSDLETFTEGSLGEHTLIWAAFIAASESRVPENRRFFAQFLMRQYRRSRFVNISKALDLLKHIWSRNSNEDWTTLLPGPGVFIM
ncbi:hypothetical protein VE02_09323 [Pseudogymnoascus sp. 03VT05]|nr:hypothetical protein VE02_09323 [Pseudogymnoascus sp. 03VT05]